MANNFYIYRYVHRLDDPVLVIHKYNLKLMKPKFTTHEEILHRNNKELKFIHPVFMFTPRLIYLYKRSITLREVPTPAPLS